MGWQLNAVGTAFEQIQRPGRTIARIGSLSIKLAWQQTAIFAIAALSGFLGLFRIGREGYANDYYAAAVKSMLNNWHAFFFVSFDSAGFVIVDKPQLGLWIQTAFALVLGFHGWSVLLPQALSSVGSVIVVNLLVRRYFGVPAGLLAALALAVAPINVAASRNNTSDTVLVFVLLLAAWAVMLAAERGSLRCLLVGMALVGLGFNIKMLQAYLVLPALVLVYLVTPVVPFRRRIGHLTIAAGLLLIVSFSWATIVELTPADQRPYIGSSDTNSVFNLIFGYNGLNRLLPDGWSIFGITNGSEASSGGGPGGGGGVGGVRENGAEGPLRLLNLNLGGQIGWLIPFAVVGLFASWGRPLLRRFDGPRRSLVLWGIWLATQAVFFSVAGFYHRYYLSMLSPAVAALSGIAAAALWSLARRGSWRALFLPIALAICVASQIRILQDYPIWRDRLVIPIAAVAGVSVLGLLIFRIGPLARSRFAVAARPFVVVGCLSLLVAPAAWSGITVTRATNGTLPVAGPEEVGGGFGLGDGSRIAAANQPVGNVGGFTAAAGDPRGGTDSALISYLVANQGGSKYLVAVQSANNGSQNILQTGKAVMAMGGFSGSDPILTVDKLKTMIADGDVRFFLSGGIGGRGAGSLGSGGRPTNGAATTPDSQSSDGAATGSQLEPPVNGASGFGQGTGEVEQWIQKNCNSVPASDYQSDTTATTTGQAQTLYDCQSAATN